MQGRGPGIQGHQAGCSISPGHCPHPLVWLEASQGDLSRIHASCTSHLQSGGGNKYDHSGSVP